MRNVIANSRLSWKVHSTPSGPRCRRNVVRRNCVFSGLNDPEQGSNGGVQKPSRSYRAQSQSHREAAGILDRGVGDLRLREGSACWRLVRR